MHHTNWDILGKNMQNFMHHLQNASDIHDCAIEEMLKLILYTHCKIQNNRLGCSKKD